MARGVILAQGVALSPVVVLPTTLPLSFLLPFLFPSLLELLSYVFVLCFHGHEHLVLDLFSAASEYYCSGVAVI